jgi:hypothetical protein
VKPHVTEATLRDFLGRECVSLSAPGEDPDIVALLERIAALLSAGDEALRGARLLVEHAIYSQAMNSLEEVVMRFGEATALAYDCTIPGGDGYHWKAAEIVRLYCEAMRPDLARSAGQFQRLREKRNKVKYQGEAIGDADVALFRKVVDQFVPAFRSEPRDRLLRNFAKAR